MMKRLKQMVAMMLVLVTVLSISSNSTSNVVKAATTVTTTVAEIQKYGNLTLDIKPQVLFQAGYELGDILMVTVDDQEFEIPFCTSYSDVDTGSLVLRDDQSNNLVVIAINMGNFSTTYNVEVGDQVEITLKESEGYLSEYLLRQLTRTNNREDYESDEVFANFREITTTGIKEGILYRSSNPANNELGRAAYANAFVEAAGITTVLDLADSAQELRSYFREDDFTSDYYKALYMNGQVHTLNMSVDVSSYEFGQKLKEGIQFMISHDGPYLIHCTEGKDRAGFVSAVLECLMGASLDEVVEDYMVTYINYYGVEKDSEQYEAIAQSNIITSLCTVVCGYDKGTSLTDVDLSAAAKSYLLNCGLKESEITTLQEKLGTDTVE